MVIKRIKRREKKFVRILLIHFSFFNVDTLNLEKLLGLAKENEPQRKVLQITNGILDMRHYVIFDLCPILLTLVIKGI